MMANICFRCRNPVTSFYIIPSPIRLIEGEKIEERQTKPIYLPITLCAECFNAYKGFLRNKSVGSASAK